MEFNQLEGKTTVAAIYYLERDEQSIKEQESVKNQLNKLISRNFIAVYDQSNTLTYGRLLKDEYINAQIIQKIRSQGTYTFENDYFFYYGIFYHDNQGDFVVITKQSKQEFHDQLRALLLIIFGVFIGSCIVIFFVSKWLGKIAYAPVESMILQLKKRESHQLTEELQIKESYKEIDELVQTYNHLFNKINENIKIQKNFIDYASHELRTPIAAVLGTVEVTEKKIRTSEEYQNVLNQIKRYTNDLQQTLETMQFLSGANKQINFQPFSWEDLIWDVVGKYGNHSQATIDVQYRLKELNLLEQEGNPYLLALGLNNLIDNALKYSENQPVLITISAQQGKLCIEIIDRGIGILPDDISHVKNNFYRGKNVNKFSGKGIGLSLANTIFELHQIKLYLESTAKGTKVTLLYL